MEATPIFKIKSSPQKLDPSQSTQMLGIANQDLKQLLHGYSSNLRKIKGHNEGKDKEPKQRYRNYKNWKC